MTDETKEYQAQQYNMLAKKFHKTYEDGKEKGHQGLTIALENTRQELTEAGDFSAEQSQDLMDYLTRDLEQTIADMEEIGDAAKEKLHPSRLGDGALASTIAVFETTNKSLHTLSQKPKTAISYKTGELSSAETLNCESCGQEINLKATAHIPPCPKCKATTFSKSY
jgi:isocitrate dehydrogenase